MKLALVACTDNAETLWNVFRLGNMALEKMDEVTIFLNGPSVDYGTLDSEDFPLLELAKFFTLSEGMLLA